jgi:hypothetical protein
MELIEADARFHGKPQKYKVSTTRNNGEIRMETKHTDLGDD